MSAVRTDSSGPLQSPTEVPPCWSMEPPSAANRGTGGGWDSYWEGLSDQQAIFHAMADEYVKNLVQAVSLDEGLRVLDFGCGFGFVAERLAPRVSELSLWDGAANMRRLARARLAGFSNIRFLDLSAPSAFPVDPRFDAILVNSVAQYLTPDEFSGWLAHWRIMLAPAGRLVISDLIPPDYRASRDLWTVLKFSARHGSLLRALAQAPKELTRYFRVRHARPLTRFGRDELTQRAAAAGLTATFLPRNLTHFPERISAVFTRAAH